MFAIFLKSKFFFVGINKILMHRILVGLIIPIWASLNVVSMNHSTSNTSDFVLHNA